MTGPPCKFCGAIHERPDGAPPNMLDAELHIISLFACPWCGARAGQLCIDARLHRKRGMQDPRYRDHQRGRRTR